MGHEVLDAAGVPDDDARKAEPVLEQVSEQAVVGVDGASVDRVEGGHDGSGAGVNDGLEGRQVGGAQALIGHVDGVVVTSPLSGAVADEVLGRGHQCAGLVQALVLVALHHGCPHGTSEQRVLPESLRDTPPARVPGDVHHGREGPGHSAGSGLGPADLGAGAGDLGGERSGHGQWRGENGALAVDDVQADEQRDAVLGLLDGGALDGVGRGSVAWPEQGTNA